MIRSKARQFSFNSAGLSKQFLQRLAIGKRACPYSVRTRLVTSSEVSAAWALSHRVMVPGPVQAWVQARVAQAAVERAAQVQVRGQVALEAVVAKAAAVWVLRRLIA